MIDHLTLRVTDAAKSRAFYEAALAPLGYESAVEYEEFVGFAPSGGRPDFWLAPAQGPIAPIHFAFHANGSTLVAAFHKAALAAGGQDNGPPGPRPDYHLGYVGGFVLDPDGNNVEAVFHGRHSTHTLDHLGLRVTDYARSKAFYEKALAPLGYEVLMEFDQSAGIGANEKPDFWITEVPQRGFVPLHVALTAPSRETVRAFHAAALAAGATDNGAPGIRKDYGPNYYAAFVRDPDGHNVELVHRG